MKLPRARITLPLVLLLLCAPAARAQRRVFTDEFQVYPRFQTLFQLKPRQLIVWRPPGYDKEPERRYPVLYMHDGLNVFASWRLDELAKPLIAAREIEPLIIVMVPNGGRPEDRFDEYTPTRPGGYTSGGKADNYGRMLVEELKPFIDSEYRTLPDAAHTALGGTSLGGLVSLYLGLKHPTVFGRLAVMSPSVWWDNRVILNQVKKLKAKPDTRIWLDVGKEESTGYKVNVRDLRDALVKKGWALDADLMYFEAKGGEHDEESWARRAPQMLKYLFPPRAENPERK